MGALKDILHKYLSDDVIQLYELEENADDMSGWMLQNGFSKRIEKKFGNLSHHEYVLTKEGKMFLNDAYKKQYEKLLSKIEDDDPENEYHLLNEIKSFMKHHYDEYVKQRELLSRQEILVLQHFEKQI